MIRLFKQLEVDAKWCILERDVDIYKITKMKFHNVLQGVNTNDPLTDLEKHKLKSWYARNWNLLGKHLCEGNIIVIDDPQPSGLIPYIKKHNPKAKVVYRSHIQIDTNRMEKPDAIINITMDFLWNQNRVKDVDCWVSHPVKEFIPSCVPQDKVVLIAASTDPLDGLNKPFTQEQSDYYFNLLNHFLLCQHQTPVDRTRPYITQIARFDPSKGIYDVLDVYVRVRKKFAGMPIEKIPQLVIAGHGADDDPQGKPYYQQLFKHVHESFLYKDFLDDIKLAKLPHNDQALNSIMRGAKVVLQLSYREGLEVKVTEALMKGKPIVIYNTGGMPLQVIKDVNSFVIPFGKREEVAEKVFQLLTDEKLYAEMSKNAMQKANATFYTVNNVTEWLYIANEMLEKENVTWGCKRTRTLMKENPHVKHVPLDYCWTDIQEAYLEHNSFAK